VPFECVSGKYEEFIIGIAVPFEGLEGDEAGVVFFNFFAVWIKLIISDLSV
jgi:hypothetical protein